MQTASITQLLTGQVAVGAEVEVRGWVRTRRDSKAGLSFLQVSDGSCQGTIQVVAKSDLPNYVDGVQKLSAGCSLTVRGALVESRGKGQSVELQASSVEVVGLVDFGDAHNGGNFLVAVPGIADQMREALTAAGFDNQVD